MTITYGYQPTFKLPENPQLVPVKVEQGDEFQLPAGCVAMVLTGYCYFTTGTNSVFAIDEYNEKGQLVLHNYYQYIAAATTSGTYDMFSALSGGIEHGGWRPIIFSEKAKIRVPSGDPLNEFRLTLLVWRVK